MGRRSFPDETLEFILSELTPKPLILDIGCGTGLSTRTLADFGALAIGCDHDPLMIRAAFEEESRGTSYSRGAAEQIPFADDQFDAVTCFSSFHWFNQARALTEIRRVLRPGGLLAISNKSDAGNLKKEFRRAIGPYVRSEIPDIKRGYAPREWLSNAGFVDIRCQAITTRESYSVAEAVAYLQSVSLWNLVPVKERARASATIHDLCCLLARDNRVEREIIVTTVVGRKSACVQSLLSKRARS